MGFRRVMRSSVAYVDERLMRWRTGATEGQILVLGCLSLLCVALLIGSLVAYPIFPAATLVVPLLLGSLTLRYRPLWVLVGVVAFCAAIAVAVQSRSDGITGAGISNLITLSIVAALLLLEARHRRSGLPGSLGEAMLVELSDRLKAQGSVPELPPGWSSQWEMRSAGGARFSGDFLVANVADDKTTLEVILVDVCGKGVAAGTRSLQLAGVLGGLIGALPPLGLLAAVNDYLVRQEWQEGFATAVYVMIDTDSGRYSIISAGHPPALLWTDRQWHVDSARGLALGLIPRPEFKGTSGTLAPGEALLIYTDGIVERRDRGIGDGIEWLRQTATHAMSDQLDGTARRILNQVTARDDDRAVLLLARDD